MICTSREISLSFYFVYIHVRQPGEDDEPVLRPERRVEYELSKISKNLECIAVNRKGLGQLQQLYCTFRQAEPAREKAPFNWVVVVAIVVVHHPEDQNLKHIFESR